MTLTFNSSQVKRTSDMCFELSKALSILSIANGALPFSPQIAFANGVRLFGGALVLFYISLKLLELEGG